MRPEAKSKLVKDSQNITWKVKKADLVVRGHSCYWLITFEEAPADRVAIDGVVGFLKIAVLMDKSTILPLNNIDRPVQK